jgi:hypothetical protein
MSSNASDEVTAEEEAFGFEVRESPTGIRAVVRAIDDGLLVVKRRRADGVIEYAICDTTCTPLYRPASSLAELAKRFPK